MSSCGRVEQEEVLLTGTEVINVTVFVILFIAFCDINVIMHGSAITHESIRIEQFGSGFGCYSAYSRIPEHSTPFLHPFPCLSMSLAAVHCGLH
jgi:hypothetical protein